MNQPMIRYTLRAEHVAENERCIAAVFEQLRREAPSAFRAVTSGIRDRCEETPTTTNLREVGAYRLFGA